MCTFLINTELKTLNKVAYLLLFYVLHYLMIFKITFRGISEYGIDNSLETFSRRRHKYEE